MPVHPPVRPGRTSLLLLLLVAVAAYGAGGATLWLAHWQPPEPGSATDATPTAGGNLIVALGRLRPAKKELTIVGPAGDQIAKISAEPGQAGKQDDVLVRLAS